MTSFEIAYSWDGQKLMDDELASVSVWVEGNDVWISVDAPFNGDPAPESDRGSTEELWKFEVVEVFLGNSEKPYLEVELGPHGHYLVITLADIRAVTASGLPLNSYVTSRTGSRWKGIASFPREYLPAGGVTRGNAFAIRGIKNERRYMAANPTGGARPDFHKPSTFLKLTLY